MKTSGKWIGVVGACLAVAACVRRAPPPPLVAVHATPTSSHTSSVPAPPAYDPVATPPAGDPATANGAETSGGSTVATTTTAAVLPESLSRDDVLRAVHGVDAQIRACGRGHPQTIMVQVTFSSSGALSAAEPQESARGSAEASCVVAALRAARTPPFRAPSLQMWVPISVE